MPNFLIYAGGIIKMNYDRLKWCKKQNKGIKLVEPNEDISKEYMKEARNDYDMISKSTVKWKTITAYYACYEAVYSILVKLGIKSEIHDCTIALMPLLEFEKRDMAFLESLKEARIKTQYYLQPSDLRVNSKRVLEFISACEQIKNALNDDKLNQIREFI